MHVPRALHHRDLCVLAPRQPHARHMYGGGYCTLHRTHNATGSAGLAVQPPIWLTARCNCTRQSGFKPGRPLMGMDGTNLAVVPNHRRSETRPTGSNAMGGGCMYTVSATGSSMHARAMMMCQNPAGAAGTAESAAICCYAQNTNLLPGAVLCTSARHIHARP